MEVTDELLSPAPTPHQLALTLISQSIFPTSRSYPTLFPTRESIESWYIQESQWLMRMLQLITRETMGIYQPSTYEELCEEVDGLRKRWARDKRGEVVNAPLAILKRMPSIFVDVQSAFEQIELLLQLYVDGDEEVIGPNVIIQHTSPIAHFLRHIYIGYKILTFTQAYVLADGVLRYCGVADTAAFRRLVARDEKRGLTSVYGGAYGYRGADGRMRMLDGRVVRVEEDELVEEADVEEDEVGKRLDQFLGGLLPGPDPDAGLGAGVLHSGPANRLTEIDDTIDVRVSTFQEYQKAQKRGDYARSHAMLMKFYDYRFPTNQGRALMHHAMLNLAFFHYSTGGLEAAAAAVEETITMARHVNDEQCLKQAFSLARRLTSEMRPPMGSIMIQGLPPHTDDVGDEDKYATPLDELWSLKQRLDLGDTAPNTYNRIHRVIGRVEAVQRAMYEESIKMPLPADHPLGNEASLREREDHQRKLKEEREADAAQAPLRSLPQSGMVDAGTLHATQSGVWDLLGCKAVAELHHDIASQCPRPAREVDLTLAINKSERQTRRGQSMEALSRLLEPYVWENLSLSEYHKWAEAVWDVAETHAVRREAHDVIQLIRSCRAPTYAYRQLGPGGPTRMRDHCDEPYSQELFNPEGNGIESRAADRLASQLADVKLMEAHGSAPLQVLEPLLSAVHVSGKLGLWLTHRRAAADLAEVFGRIEARSDGKLESVAGAHVDKTMLRSGELEVEPLWVQILATEDEEIVFTASWVLARAKRTKDMPAAVTFAKACFRSALALRSPSRMLKICALLILMERAGGIADEQQLLRGYWQAVKNRKSVLPIPDGVCALVSISANDMGPAAVLSGGAYHDTLEDIFDLDMARDLRETVTLVGVNIAGGE